MRTFFLTIIFLFEIIFSEAQISREEIKKYYIYKITEKSFKGDSLTEVSASYFDKTGNIIKGVSGRLTEITTDTFYYENDRLKKTINFDFEHMTEYFYNPDGSYMTITTAKYFGAKNYFWFNEKGDILKASAGGDTILYKYNEKGKLVSMRSQGNNQETKFNVEYTYNEKNQLIKVEMPKDEFNNTTETYKYDSDGKRTKATQRTILHGITRNRVTTYKYNKKGLLVKEITIDTRKRNKKTSTKNVYEYEFYGDKN